MDELEIDGKKYLSSRRAAKEHKYHIDYIGQLIRAGKVVGKKVGRSWYVEQGSLKSYLMQEAGGSAPTPEDAPEIIEQPVKIFAAPVQEVEEEVLQPIAYVPPPAVPQPVVRKVYFSTPEKEPAAPSNLTYVEDDEPMLPVLGNRVRTNADFVAVPVRRTAMQEVEDTDEEYAQDDEEEYVSAPVERSHKIAVPRIATFAVLAAVLIVVAAAAAGSAFLGTSIKVSEGQPASVGITIK